MLKISGIFLLEKDRQHFLLHGFAPLPKHTPNPSPRNLHPPPSTGIIKRPILRRKFDAKMHGKQI